MGWSSTCFKCVLNTFNTIWAIFSVLLIAGAVLNYGEVPLFLVCLAFVIGFLGLAASILGCCGTCNDNIKLTKAYAIIIAITLVIQIIALIILSTRNVTQDYAVKEINERWEKEVKKEAVGGMDFAQKEYKCCGRDEPSDYITILHREYPNSCYPRQFVNQSALFTDGCIHKASIYYESYMKNLLGGSWGSIVFTIVMLLLAIYLLIRFRNKQSSQRFNYNECPMK